jgi:hypothetical protein
VSHTFSPLLASGRAKILPSGVGVGTQTGSWSQGPRLRSLGGGGGV